MPQSDPTKRPGEPDPLAVQIGREIDRARTAKGISISQLHRTTGISRTVLQGYEAGRYKPGAREIRLLAEALECSPNKLLFGREEFRSDSPLDAVLGTDKDKASNSAKIAIVFGMLTIEEQRAFLNLLSLMAEARIGGREKLRLALSTVDAMLTTLEGKTDLEQRFNRVMSPDEAEAVATAMAKATPELFLEQPPPKKRQKISSKPGK